MIQLVKHMMPEKRDRKKGKLWILFPVLTFLFALFLFFYIQNYTKEFQNVISEETEGYMLEIAQQITLTINDRVNTNIKNLEMAADAIIAMAQTDHGQLEAFLESTARRYGYTSLQLANSDGRALTDTGQIVNVSRQKHYLSALQGKSTISGVILSDYNNTDSIECAVPIQNDEKTEGVLIAGYNLRDFEDILKVTIFGGSGDVSVIDSKGVIIVRGGEKDTYNFNRFLKETAESEKYERFIDDIAEGESGTLQYQSGGQSLLTYYQPLGINDWYLLVSTSTEQITSKTDLFLQGLTYTGLAVAVMITLLMLVIILIQRKNSKALEQLLYTDPVTGGISYTRLVLDAGRYIADKGAGYYAILQLNVEHFKLINTSFGRESGNQLLRYIYETITADLRSDELVARTNADRFCLLLQYHSPEELAARLESISEAINRFNDGKKSKYLLCFDAGACVVDSESPDIDMFYERANFSRTHGGAIRSVPGALAFYNEVERSVVVREKEIENRMEEALAQGEFETYLQPKYGLKDNHIAGAEALVRWKDPQRGLISPGEFIPLFERNGFIVKLDLYIFEQVCILLQKLWDKGDRCVPISVNLSRRHLENQNFLQKYQEVFVKYSFPSSLIEIELTESIVFDNMQQLCRVIEEIHQIGFECSMDDFGSGYSSLNMLKDIPVDTLKLDRAFFYSESGDPTKSRYVVENVIDLAQKLQMKTVSEGIESIDQVDFLRKTCCDMVQGYVFAKPMPVTQFEELLKNEEI